MHLRIHRSRFMNRPSRRLEIVQTHTNTHLPVGLCQQPAQHINIRHQPLSYAPKMRVQTTSIVRPLPLRWQREREREEKRELLRESERKRGRERAIVGEWEYVTRIRANKHAYTKYAYDTSFITSCLVCVSAIQPSHMSFKPCHYDGFFSKHTCMIQTLTHI